MGSLFSYAARPTCRPKRSSLKCNEGPTTPRGASSVNCSGYYSAQMTATDMNNLYDSAAETTVATVCFKANGTPEISVGTAQHRVIIARREESAEIVASTLDASLGARELEAFLESLSQVVRARGGFTAAARKTGLNRTSLYAILSSSGNPMLSTLVALLSAAGLRLSVEPLDELREAQRTDS
jgi:probable addiction module antidote protein